MAHITGGGLTENIIRVIPDGLGLDIEASSIVLPPVFDWLQREGAVPQRRDVAHVQLRRRLRARASRADDVAAVSADLNASASPHRADRPGRGGERRRTRAHRLTGRAMRTARRPRLRTRQQPAGAARCDRARARSMRRSSACFPIASRTGARTRRRPRCAGAAMRSRMRRARNSTRNSPMPSLRCSRTGSCAPATCACSTTPSSRASADACSTSIPRCCRPIAACSTHARAIADGVDRTRRQRRTSSARNWTPARSSRRRRVPVLPGDTPDALAERVLAVEHPLLVAGRPPRGRRAGSLNRAKRSSWTVIPCCARSA